MANYVSSITIDAVIDALAAFITPFVGDSVVIRAQVNRVAMPLDSVVVLTELLQVDLSTPFTDYQPANDKGTMHSSSRVDVQIDFYGSQAGEYCQVIRTAMRTSWGFDNFPQNIKPLYTGNGVQAPLITGEEQYESRWTLVASLQYNPLITIPQQFADDATVNLFIQADSSSI